MRPFSLVLCLVTPALAVGCQRGPDSLPPETPANEARCDDGSSELEADTQRATAKTEKAVRLAGQATFEGALAVGNTLEGLVTGGATKASEAWNKGKSNVKSASRARADEVKRADAKRCPERPAPAAAPATPTASPPPASLEPAPVGAEGGAPREVTAAPAPAEPAPGH